VLRPGDQAAISDSRSSRLSYEPNSLAAYGEDGGPRELPMTGFSTVLGCVQSEELGDKLRVRAELFADHYSQARLFWKSQTDNERAHIASSFTFELSKVALEAVPGRVVANLRKDAAAVQFVMDAFGHLKAIGVSKAALSLLDKAGIETDEGITSLGKAFVEAAGRRYCGREPNVRALA